MNYQMVPLTMAHISALAQLEKLCFDDPWTKGMLASELGNPLTVYRLMMDGDTPVAYMGMWCVADEGQITNVAVHPDHRRRGLAQQLIRFFIDYAKLHELTALTLEVRASNGAAQKLYEKMGFETVGFRKNYYGGKEDAVLMTLFIEKLPKV